MLTLERLLEVAVRSPLYEGWNFCGITGFGDEAWSRLPTLTRDRIRPIEPVGRGGSDLLFYTSGTTGEPRLIHYGPDDLVRVAELCARFSRLEGVTSDSRVMVLLPMGLWTVGKITVEGHRLAGAQVFPVDLHGGVVSWQRMATLIRPTVISSTPSVLSAWAPHYRGPPLELVETTGEPLLHRERHSIEGCFGAFVHDAYGLSECVVGTECAMRDGFHYWPDATGVEVLESGSDRLVPAGEVGELVLTSFMQERMPILRYRSGDLGWIEQGSCLCGSKLPRVRLKGRMADTLSLPRAVNLDIAELRATLDALAVGTAFRYKGTPGSPAAPYVDTMFHPLLEITVPASDATSWSALRQELFAALPALAELVHERELDLQFVAYGPSSPTPKVIA